MEVKIKRLTEDPIQMIDNAMSMSTMRMHETLEAQKRRVKHAVSLGHGSVLEFAHLIFEVHGISRACSHQLVRHRLCSFCQTSQRYTKIDTTTNDWYILPPSIKANLERKTEFKRAASMCAFNYNKLLANGIRPEDARYLLPEATKTSIMIGMNLREFFNFLELRLDSHAHWEIRELAEKMADLVSNYDEQWDWLMALRKSKEE